MLESEGRQWREWFIGAIEAGGGDPQTKLSRIFPALKTWFAEERFYGCPFINAVAEHDKDAKQFRNIALKHKKVVLAHIEKLAGEMGAAEPAVLAHQLALLIDGAIVAAMVSRFSAGRRNSTLSSSATRLSKNACIWCWEAGSDRSGIANGSAPAVESLNHS